LQRILFGLAAAGISSTHTTSHNIGVEEGGQRGNRPPAWKLFGQILKYSGKPEKEDLF